MNSRGTHQQDHPTIVPTSQYANCSNVLEAFVVEHSGSRSLHVVVLMWTHSSGEAVDLAPVDSPV